MIEAVGGGHEHRLLPGSRELRSSPGLRPGSRTSGSSECTESAYIAHPEHAYAGIAAGTYILRRQREQADWDRFVAD